MSEIIWDEYPQGMSHFFEHFFSLSLSSFFFLFLSSRCVFLNKTVKRDPYVSYATSTGYTCSIYIYAHTYLLRMVRLMWLTSQILTPDALFSLLHLYISYASYLIPYLLIIPMTFNSLSITREII